MDPLAPSALLLLLLLLLPLLLLSVDDATWKPVLAGNALAATLRLRLATAMCVAISPGDDSDDVPGTCAINEQRVQFKIQFKN